MGLMSFLRTLFSGSRAITEVAGAFVPNAENSARREAEARAAVAVQFAAEFQRQRLGWFDSLVDGINRLPRPTLAFGTIWLMVYAMRDPVAFGERMQGLSLVPDPLWWIMGAIISFYFGAREMQKFRAGQVASPRLVRNVVQNIAELRALDPGSGPETEVDSLGAPGDANAALSDWRNSKND